MFFNDGNGRKTKKPAPLGFGGVKPRKDSEELTLQVGFPKVSRWTQLFGVQGDRTIIAVETFDPAFMAAMDRPWRDIVFSQSKVVASGMTPPDHLPT
jgi:hypothetical protein